MKNVKALDPSVNAPSKTLEHVYSWYEAKASRGELPASTARLRVTALKQLISVLAADEPRDLDWISSRVEELARRWGTLNPNAKADTIRTYASRVRTSLQDYLSWCSDPSSFRFNRREPDADRARPKPRPKRDAHVDATSEQQPMATPDGSKVRSFPLKERGDFSFSLPEELKVLDVMRIACHLMTLCDDFDPTRPNQAQFFSLAKREV